MDIDPIIADFDLAKKNIFDLDADKALGNGKGSWTSSIRATGVHIISTASVTATESQDPAETENKTGEEVHPANT